MVTAARSLLPVRAGTATWPSLTEHLASPWSGALMALLAGVAVVFGRLELVDHGDVTRFIGLGVVYTHRSGLPPGLFVGRGAGWDGQYFYRLAIDPFNLHRTAFGVTFDTSYRLQRIGYPALAWLAAAGRTGLVPWTLVGLNTAALGVLGGLGGILARDAGRHPLWGLLLAGYWGFPLTVSWDLSGAVLAASLVGALLALRHHRPVLATTALTAAVLTKETAVVLVAALALSDLLARRRGPISAYRCLVWAVPLALFAGWQVVIRALTGTGGVSTDTGANFGRPFAAVGGEIVRDVRNMGNAVSLIDLTEIALMVGLVALAIVTARQALSPMHERIALIGLATLAVCLSRAVWGGEKDLRSLAELFTVAMVVLIGSRRRLLVPATLVGYLWVLVAAIQMTKI